MEICRNSRGIEREKNKVPLVEQPRNTCFIISNGAQETFYSAANYSNRNINHQPYTADDVHCSPYEILHDGTFSLSAIYRILVAMANKRP
jgi:hypothetical protein